MASIFNFNPSIDATYGYVIKNKKGKNYLFDGDSLLFEIKQILSVFEMAYEMSENESFVIMERFITTDGHKYLYVVGFEMFDGDYLVEINDDEIRSFINLIYNDDNPDWDTLNNYLI